VQLDIKLENNWKFKSLLNLEKRTTFTPQENPPARLVKRCEELCQIPLIEYTIEDLRLMISQEFGLSYLIPLAVEKLQTDLFAEGDLYPGDLLASVLKIDPSFWHKNQELWVEINELIKTRKVEVIAEGISTEIFESSLK